MVTLLGAGHYGDDAEAHAAELAEHFAEAETVLGSAGMVRYSTAAGEQSLAGHAYEAAAAHFEAALGAAPPEDAALLAGLHFGLGRALLQILGREQMQRAIDELLLAFDGFVNADRTDAALSVAQLNIPNVQGTVGKVQMLRRALELTGSDDVARCNILTSLARWESFESYDPEAAFAASTEAIAIAQRMGNIDQEFRALAEQFIWSSRSPGESKVRERLDQLISEVDQPLFETVYYMVNGFGLLASGDTNGASKSFADQVKAAERSHNN